MRSLLLPHALLLASPAAAQVTETVDQALCRMIEKSAADYRVPVAYFTRLIWQESSFRPGVVSGAGAGATAAPDHNGAAPTAPTRGIFGKLLGR